MSERECSNTNRFIMSPMKQYKLIEKTEQRASKKIGTVISKRCLNGDS